MSERETARRVFAREFNDADLQSDEHADRSPNFIITPMGVVCNRIFVVGVLTEVENIGGDGQTLYKARIADPTGVFTVYAGQYQPSAAMFLSEAQTPSYVAVVGKARVFSPEKGSYYVSIRPEEVNPVDERVRNRWVYNTARLTARNIEAVRKALMSGLRGSELIRHMSPHTDDAEGISKAIDHYSVSFNTLEAYKQMVADALSTIAEIPTDKMPETSADASTGSGSIDGLVADAILRLDGGDGAEYEGVLEELMRLGYGEDDVERSIGSLMDSGRCYEPKLGVLKLI